jgi:hypothetical protein
MKSTILAFVLLTLASATLAQEEVLVINLPTIQPVQGEVTVTEPIPQTELQSLGEKVVPPLQRSETTALVPGGLIDAEGFRTAVVSIAGFVQGQSLAEGTVGAILLPDEDSILRVFREEAQIQLELEVTAGSTPSDAYFSSSEALTLGFPRYRIFYYNTTDRAVSVRLFAYLGS